MAATTVRVRAKHAGTILVPGAKGRPTTKYVEPGEVFEFEVPKGGKLPWWMEPLKGKAVAPPAPAEPAMLAPPALDPDPKVPPGDDDLEPTDAPPGEAGTGGQSVI